MSCKSAGVRSGPMFSGVVCLAALGGVAGWASPAAATDWLEPRDNDRDAGEYSAFAQVPEGLGELESITGRLDGGFADGGGFGAPPGVPDYQDLFMIKIAIPSRFSARTVPFGFEDINTELFLFSVDGFGLLQNDNLDPTSTFSQLVSMSSDGTFNLTTPGLYVIGVAGFGNVPMSIGGAIFSRVLPTELSGPDGPGGALVHDRWITNEIEGRYVIELTGVEYVPGPGAGVVLGLGMMARRRRR